MIEAHGDPNGSKGIIIEVPKIEIESMSWESLHHLTLLQLPKHFEDLMIQVMRLNNQHLIRITGIGKQNQERRKNQLNTDKVTILAVLKIDLDYRPPRPMNPNRPPSNRYCEFHEYTGHDTEKCFQLTNLIKDKIREGRLRHLLTMQNHVEAFPKIRTELLMLLQVDTQQVECQIMQRIYTQEKYSISRLRGLVRIPRQ